MQGHHIVHWAEGGETKLSNLVTLCRFHHRAVHEGGIVVQRLDDCFPDADHGRRCQDWLVPYFAQLLDVQLVSPDADGRRAEVAQAVSLRQRKGTRVSIEQIANALQTPARLKTGLAKPNGLVLECVYYAGDRLMPEGFNRPLTASGEEDCG